MAFKEYAFSDIVEQVTATKKDYDLNRIENLLEK